MKKIIFIDMDDTIADFQGAAVFDPKARIDESRMFKEGFFRDLRPVPGALRAIRRLMRIGFDVQILTQPVADSAHSYSEKVQWLGMWFPELVTKLNMVQDKGIVRGHYLIDDNSNKWKDRFEKGGGTFVHFPYNRNDQDKSSYSNEESWERIVYMFENIKADEP